MEQFVLSAILLFARPPVADDPARLAAIASDVAAVVQEDGAPNLFDGPAGREATALLLVAIAAHESGFAPDVDECSKRGDGGRSRTMWQLMGHLHLQGNPFAEVCSNRRLAARLALDTLQSVRLKYPSASPQRLLNAYAGGRVEMETPQSRRMCTMWQTRAARLGLKGSVCSHRRPIRWATVPQSQ